MKAIKSALLAAALLVSGLSAPYADDAPACRLSIQDVQKAITDGTATPGVTLKVYHGDVAKVILEALNQIAPLPDVDGLDGVAFAVYPEESPLSQVGLLVGDCLRVSGGLPTDMVKAIINGVEKEVSGGGDKKLQ